MNIHHDIAITLGEVALVRFDQIVEKITGRVHVHQLSLDRHVVTSELVIHMIAENTSGVRLALWSPTVSGDDGEWTTDAMLMTILNASDEIFRRKSVPPQIFINKVDYANIERSLSRLGEHPTGVRDDVVDAIGHAMSKAWKKTRRSDR